jgi:hypothetical protein
MTSTTIFDRFDTLFRSRTDSTRAGREGSLEVKVISLADGNRLRCGMDGQRAHWYEVVFNDDGRPMRVGPETNLTLGDMEILDSVLRENRA